MFGTKALIIGFIALVLINLISLGFFPLPFLGQTNLEILPEKIFQRIFDTNYFNKLQNPRIEIWSKAIKLITEKPLLGWGAASFPILFLLGGGVTEAQHTHNMFLEIAQINGLPIAITLTTFVSLLIYKTYKTIYHKNNSKEIDKAWLASSLIIIFSHLTDVTYYEGRISLLIWIFLSGLKCIIDSPKENKIIIKKY
jgi:O-antigen ligase